MENAYRVDFTFESLNTVLTALKFERIKYQDGSNEQALALIEQALVEVGNFKVVRMD